MPLKAYTHSPKSGATPRSMVIVLHGYGTNGADLIDLARYWEGALPDTIFVSPDAPFPCEGAPFGFQWFSLRSFDPDAMVHGMAEAVPILNQFIDKMLEHYDLKEENLALAGFSQGTMMALYTGPRRGARIAGVLGYSGRLLGEESLNSPNVHKIPVHLIHGDEDEVLSVRYYHMAREALEHSGFPVTGGVTRGLTHSIDSAGIESGAVFLAKIF
jgi:phospholipase/carboxylesterase